MSINKEYYKKGTTPTIRTTSEICDPETEKKSSEIKATCNKNDNNYASIYDKDGFNRAGRDKDGRDRDGYDWDGKDRDGYDRTGFNLYGIHKITGTYFDPDGYNSSGRDHDGYDRSGFNANGYDRDGYGRDGFNKNGLDREGFDKLGFDPDGFNRSGLDRNGFNRNGIHNETLSNFDPNGYDIERYGKDGFNKEGYNRLGFDRNGFNKKGYDSEGYDREGYNNEGYNRAGFNRNGFDQEGVDSSGNPSLAKWKKILTDTCVYPFVKTKWEAREIHKLTPEDWTLAKSWAGGEIENPHILAKMLSARCAEKIAIKFYKNLGYQVDDISITQTTSSSEIDSWKICDIVLNNENFIDIKNSRTTFNSISNYSEHCVPKFKKSRTNSDVIITGVLSSYVNLGDIQKKQISSTKSISVLGETYLPQLLQLERRFSSKLIRVSTSDVNFVPRWLFEYPELFYEARNKSREHLRSFLDKNVPEIDISSSFNPIPAYISSGASLPYYLESSLEYFQINFCRRIKPQTGESITLPILFLALLTHFIEVISGGRAYSNYDPILYRKILYIDNDSGKCFPFGIYDHLNSISELIETLSKLWSNRKKIDLDHFEHFKFHGSGLLQGKKPGQDKYITIIAYCGGFIEGLGKCGYSPLVLGENNTCPSCGRLICDLCGHCSTNCPSCKKRMAIFIEKNCS